MFAPGHHLYRSVDGSWRYSAPGDVFVRIGGDDRLLTLVQQLEAGVPGVSVPEADRVGVERIIAALTERGVLVDPDHSLPVPAGWKVHIEGDDPIPEKLLELLDEAECTVGCVDEHVVARSDVIVSCAQWLPDARWRQLDSWCTEHRTPWHGCHAEGATFVIGPLSIPGRTASYRDTRGRRLAAAALPDELIAHWAYLDSDAVKPAVRFTPAAVSVLAGLLAADLLALAAGTGVPSEGHQLVIDLATLSITRHRVLPLPELAINPA
ncbi:TOMM precursor leader peptide-binding protein [Protofrankia symbiont of Coriaria ruscifolia]|uniref:Uncharacterized protein n=1 Tax=Candidatus Protofrankia californiensis TaxID=1839754 RepID=A0A1C3NYG2_9ACTN|nr:TOMM precursor leader peptide-binding protein [Protofrankia symbiont of Coriaria ruscifolia]SBW22571.1 hypothetical protein FDG2_2823 [Candidatus Protofrankia californiensis]